MVKWHQGLQGCALEGSYILILNKQDEEWLVSLKNVICSLH